MKISTYQIPWRPFGIYSVDELILSHEETDTIWDLDNTSKLCAFVDSFSMTTVLFMLAGGGGDTWRCLNRSRLPRTLIFYAELFELLMYLFLKDLGIFPNK